MAELKTKQNDTSVESFLAGVDDPRRREDARVVAAMMAEVTGEPAKMWGGSMIGFGNYHYVYESGREGDWFLTGLSPRKQALTLYIMAGFAGYEDLMARLGRYKIGKSCLYVKRLDDIDPNVLRELVTRSVAHMREKYGG